MLYIRHSKKLYQNGKAKQFCLDPPLTPEGRAYARKKFAEICETYPLPKMIVSSPFLRTRETALILADVVFEKTGEKIRIQFDDGIGEYLGNHIDVPPRIGLRKKTADHILSYPSRWDEYTKKIEHFMNINCNCNGNDIWYVTHGIVIQKIAEYYGYKLNYPRELQGIYVQSGVVKLVQ